jgi:uncharacterized membrane protein YkvA (DUF1232 family)
MIETHSVNHNASSSKEEEISTPIVQAAKESQDENTPIKLLNIVKLMAELIRDYIKSEYKQTPWRTIASFLFSLLYLINPFDLMPDFIPGIGWLDDITIIGLFISGVSRDLKEYCQHKGLPLEQYGLK